jgi:hypothetical protein
MYVVAADYYAKEGRADEGGSFIAAQVGSVASLAVISKALLAALCLECRVDPRPDRSPVRRQLPRCDGHVARRQRDHDHHQRPPNHGYLLNG